MTKRRAMFEINTYVFASLLHISKNLAVLHEPNYGLCQLNHLQKNHLLCAIWIGKSDVLRLK